MTCVSRRRKPLRLLKETHGLQLDVEEVRALTARTEGWAVGLTMAALSMGKRKDVQGFIATFTGSQRYVMDYLDRRSAQAAAG